LRALLSALLTVLALQPGRAVPAGVLVDEVWDGEPPADAPGALQALVGRLRRALGRDAVESAADGYRLAAGPDAVDLHCFERLAGEGARALEEGDAVKAATVLDDALALWRGPALADLPDRAVAAARWEARRLDARRTRIAAALAQDQAGEVLAELAGLCADHPLDEPLQALRIRALRDAGRTAQALAAYDEVRTLLADRLGTDPGPALRALALQPGLQPGRAVPAGVLVDEVWDGEPPADAPGALQALVGRLRRALGRDAVESAADGYRLAAGPDAVDLHCFERLAGEGARALEEGDAVKAAT
ncbi:BTAD domain-containing putative transcriptional regulator, partial [Streptomyces sp. gb1(2016)]